MSLCYSDIISARIKSAYSLYKKKFNKGNVDDGVSYLYVKKTCTLTIYLAHILEGIGDIESTNQFMET